MGTDLPTQPRRAAHGMTLTERCGFVRCALEASLPQVHGCMLRRTPPSLACGRDWSWTHRSDICLTTQLWTANACISAIRACVRRSRGLLWINHSQRGAAVTLDTPRGGVLLCSAEAVALRIWTAPSVAVHETLGRLRQHRYTLCPCDFVFAFAAGELARHSRARRTRSKLAKFRVQRSMLMIVVADLGQRVQSAQRRQLCPSSCRAPLATLALETRGLFALFSVDRPGDVR
ncbi:hypothetical protein C2E23DRAFT_492253 [Lenzites betulinus]|nr:hypothetical protein C2E23DRAFT_492253 [Lenzites betulinus]